MIKESEVITTLSGVEKTPQIENSPVAPLSQQVAETRSLLLKTLQGQLTGCIVEQLESRKDGVPFTRIDEDPPQLAAIKKVINCLYHAEEALKTWEQMSSKQGYLKMARDGYSAMRQLYSALALLNDATPEIQAIFVNNYSLLSPIFSNAYELINQSGYLAQLTGSEVVNSANTVLSPNESLVAPGPHDNSENALVSIFSTLSGVMNIAADLQQSSFSKEEKRSKLELMRSSLEHLDKIPMMHQLSAQSLGDSKALTSLMEWMSNIDENDENFTQKSIEGYLKWANEYLPTLVDSIDQLERSNYLKPGILSQEFFNALRRVDKILTETSIKPAEKIISIDSLFDSRIARINENQVDHVKTIMSVEAQKTAATEFFKILKTYAGQSFSSITEEDRHQLRQIYPLIQNQLAHESLELENQFAAILNQTGGKKDTSWGSWYTYGKSFVVNQDVDIVLKTQTAINFSLDKKIQSEELKIAVDEDSRVLLLIEHHKELEQKTSEERTEPTPFPLTSMQERVGQRIKEIKTNLVNPTDHPLIREGAIVPVIASSLKNLRGNIAYIQELNLSETVGKTTDALSTVLRNRLSKEQAALLSKPPYVIDPKEDKFINQIKEIENGLFFLEKSLKNFESLEWKQGAIANLKAISVLAWAAYRVYVSTQELTPEVKKYLAPVLQPIHAYGAALSTVNQQSGDLSSLAELKKMGEAPLSLFETVSTEQTEFDLVESEFPDSKMSKTLEEPITRKALPEEIVKTESSLDGYITQIADTRAALLTRLKHTLSPPLALKLIPQQQGEPFTNLEEDPPQLAAVKKVINSLYHVETSLKIIQGTDTTTVAGQFKAAHQGVVALSQLYKAFKHLNEAAPEVQNLIRENQDLIQPIFDQAKEVFKSSWFEKFQSGEIGSLIGKGVNGIIPGSNSKNFTLVGLLSDLPQVMRQLSDNLQQGTKTSEENLRVSNRKLKAINSILDMVAEEKLSLSALKGIKAYEGFTKLMNLLWQESGGVQKNTLGAYQSWMDQNYPQLLSLLDELETKYYLKPGTLSESIINQIDGLTASINAQIESYADPEFKKAQDSLALGEKRIASLKEYRKEQWTDLFQLEKQQNAANEFFNILDKYPPETPFSEFSPEEQLILKRHFIEIQLVMARGAIDGLKTSNELSKAFNNSEIKLTVSDITKQKAFIDNYLNQGQKASQLKIEVTNNSIAEIKSGRVEKQNNKLQALEQQQTSANNFFDLLKSYTPDHSFSKLSQEEKINLKKHFIEFQLAMVGSNVNGIKIKNMLEKAFDDPETKLKIGAITKQKEFIDTFLTQQQKECKSEIEALNKIRVDDESDLLKAREEFNKTQLSDLDVMQKELKEIDLNSLDTRIANLQTLQNLKLSDSVDTLITKLSESTKNHFSKRIQHYFKKPENSEFHVTNPNEPDVIRQVKEVENNLRYLKEALVQFEQIKTNDSLLTQTKALLAIADNAQKLITSAQSLSGEFKEQYGPLVNQILGFSDAIKALDYKKAYTPDMRLAVEGDKNDSDAWLKGTGRVFQSASSYVDKAKNFLQQSYGISTENNKGEGLVIDLSSLQSNQSDSLEESHGGLIKKVHVDLVKQLQEFETKIGELGNEVKDSQQMKEKVYTELLPKISQQEEKLFLKPGTLLKPAMDAVNKFFVSMALECDMPFMDKVALLNENEFIEILCEQTKKELDPLKSSLQLDPENSDLMLQVELKVDKLTFLQAQEKVYNPLLRGEHLKELLDLQFKVYLNRLNLSLKSPIVEQYKEAMENQYSQMNDLFSYEDDPAEAVQRWMKSFGQKNMGKYLMVSEGIDTLDRLKSTCTEERFKSVSDYFVREISYLEDPKISINERSDRVESLPKNEEFLGNINKLSNGVGFLKNFKQLIVNVTTAITEAFATGGNIIDIYEKKKTEKIIANIEKVHSMKSMLSGMKKDSLPDPEETNTQSKENDEGSSYEISSL